MRPQEKAMMMMMPMMMIMYCAVERAYER